MTSAVWKGFYFKVYLQKNTWSSWNLKANPSGFCVIGIGKKVSTFKWEEGNADYFLKRVRDMGWIGDCMSAERNIC